MFDVHCHLLYGLDDGPKTREESLALAEAQISEGVTHLVATPHASYKYSFQPATNRERRDELESALNGRITIGLGCDMHLSFENVETAKEDPRKFAINRGRYMLVEFADTGIPRQMDDTLFQLRLAGIVPIITHPERFPMLISDAEHLGDWVRQGCLVQVTAGSLTGGFGEQARNISRRWIAAGWVHLLASDAHSVKWRPPSMKAGYAALYKEFGKETADRLCIENPGAIFFDRAMPEQPEPRENLKASKRGRSGILSSLFGKKSS